MKIFKRWKKEFLFLKIKFKVDLLDYFLYFCNVKKKREIYFYKDYFNIFYENQTDKVKKKIVWTLRVIQEIDIVPEVHLKYLKNTSGLYEIRVNVGNNIFRIFCFFDQGNIIVVGHGFQKKTQKTPKQQIEKAETIKKAYYERK